MGVSPWFAEHWFDLLQTVGIVGSFLLAAYTTRKDERARRIGNSIAINEQYRQIWKEQFEHPGLSRVLSKDADVAKNPVSHEEELFATMLILHLSTVYRAMKHGEFVTLEGLERDVEGFFSLPIPKVVWQKIKPLQDRNFVQFIEASVE
jgi:plasmid maintenance system killer protein